MNLEQAKANLKALQYNTLIVGFKSDGRRGLPAGYEIDYSICNDETFLSEVLKYVEFRAFYILENDMPNDYWKKRAEEFAKDKIEAREREIYEQLKKKYEQ